MTVYLDVVIIENLIANFLIILSTNYISKQKVDYFKIAIASIAGAFAYLLLIPVSNIYLYTFLKFSISVVIVLIAYSKKNIYSLLENLLLFYVVSFIYGGIMYVIYFTIKGNETIYYYPIRMLFAGLIISFLIIKEAGKKIKINKLYKNMIFDAEIQCDNKSKLIRLFLDTGNDMKDCISNTPVAIINFSIIKEILPTDILTITGEPNMYSMHANKIRILPYSSLGNINGIMLGYKIDKMIIYFNRQETKCIKNVLIGINQIVTLENDIDGIIGIDFLNLFLEDKRYDDITIG